MKITQRKEGEVTILDCVGKLSLDEEDIPLRETVERLLGEGETMILLNLRGVGSVDSSGLGEMVAAKTTAAARGAAIKLLHVDARVQRVVEMTRLIGVFETFANEADAIASFAER